MYFIKEKCFSGLNADEVKLGSIGCFGNSLSELQKNVEKYSIFTLASIGKENETCRFGTADDRYYEYFYLIEEPKEEKYRPYQDNNELIVDFTIRATNDFYKSLPMTIPFVWIKNKQSEDIVLITRYGRDIKNNNTSFVVIDGELYSLEALFNLYTYLDGSPCGIKI